jgi:tetratricopeptide (TPR) repeat protein
MTSRTGWPLAAALIALAFARPAAAVTPDEQVCYTGSGDAAIEACNRAISSGQVRDDNLAIAYCNRAVEYKNKGDYDRAMNDLNQALRIDPRYPAAYAIRGQTWELLKQPQRAMADYRSALAAPQKHDTGKWAHEKARERLDALGAR